MPKQYPLGATIFGKSSVDGSLVPVKVNAQGEIIVETQAEEGATTALNLSANTVIKTGAGSLLGFNVITAGAVGGLYDSADVAGATAATQIAVTPAEVGYQSAPIPYKNGLVYKPGAAQVAAVVYR